MASIEQNNRNYLNNDKPLLYDRNLPRPKVQTLHFFQDTRSNICEAETKQKMVYYYQRMVSIEKS